MDYRDDYIVYIKLLTMNFLHPYHAFLKREFVNKARKAIPKSKYPRAHRLSKEIYKPSRKKSVDDIKKDVMNSKIHEIILNTPIPENYLDVIHRIKKAKSNAKKIEKNIINKLVKKASILKIPLDEIENFMIQEINKMKEERDKRRELIRQRYKFQNLITKMMVHGVNPKDDDEIRNFIMNEIRLRDEAKERAS